MLRGERLGEGHKWMKSSKWEIAMAQTKVVPVDIAIAGSWEDSEMKSTRLAGGFDIWSEGQTRMKDGHQDSCLNNNVEGGTVYWYADAWYEGGIKFGMENHEFHFIYIKCEMPVKHTSGEEW